MKKVLAVNIGYKPFTIDEDAYMRLDSYIENFRQKTQMGLQTNEVIDDLELRIAELFTEYLGSNKEIVDIVMVNRVIAQLGMPDGSSSDNFETPHFEQQKAKKRFYRNPENKAIGGVCSGLATYWNIDIVLIRVLFVVTALCGSIGFWAYIILWVVSPLANTSAQKCELRGLPITAENMRKIATNK